MGNRSGSASAIEPPEKHAAMVRITVMSVKNEPLHLVSCPRRPPGHHRINESLLFSPTTKTGIILTRM